LNIFLLDHDIELCAQYHCDQHVVKMILESVQILCTAMNKLGLETPYKSTHANHPCVLWVGGSFDNFLWLKDLTSLLNDEYQYRFDKQVDHRQSVHFIQFLVIGTLAGGLHRLPGLCQSNTKIPVDPVVAYRNFYSAEKKCFARWTKRDTPEWFLKLVSDTGYLSEMTDDNTEADRFKSTQCREH
jgi:hypothetical protein